MELNKESAIPLYHQLKCALREADPAGAQPLFSGEALEPLLGLRRAIGPFAVLGPAAVRRMRLPVPKVYCLFFLLLGLTGGKLR